MSDMFPRSSPDNVANGRRINAIHSGYFRLVYASGYEQENILDDSRSELGMVMRISAWLSSFGNHVVHVVSMAAKHKMLWIYASRIVANVHHFLVGWWLDSIVEFVGKPMRQNNSMRKLIAQLRISSPGMGAFHLPAAVGFPYFFSEFLGKRLAFNPSLRSGHIGSNDTSRQTERQEVCYE